MPRGENIYKRKDGRWEGRYQKGRKENGSIHYGYIYGYSYRELRQQLIIKKAEYTSKINQSTITFNGSFGQWANQWLNGWMIDQLKESTYASYQNKLSLHVLPEIGDIPLQKLTSQQLQMLVQGMQKKLSPSSIQIVFRIVKSCLKTAKERGLIFINPAESIHLPKIQKKQVPALSKNQHKLILEESKKEMKYLPILIAVETGLRIGEISALKWSDVDLDNNLLHVSKTKQRISTLDENNKTKLIESTPKTLKSVRSIPLTITLIEALKKAEVLKKSSHVIEVNGRGVEPRTISYRFEKLKQKLGLVGFVFHSLRHTFATRCVELGINIATISALLGHASIKMTLDTYTCSFVEDRKEAINQYSAMSF